MVNTTSLSNSFLTRMDNYNDQGGALKKIGVKCGLIAIFIPSTFAAIGHTFLILLQTTMVPLKCSVKVLTLGFVDVNLQATFNSIKSNSKDATRFAFGAVAIPLLTGLSNSSAVKIGNLLGLTKVYTIKWYKTEKAQVNALIIRRKYLHILELIESKKDRQAKMGQIPDLECQGAKIKWESMCQSDDITDASKNGLFRSIGRIFKSDETRLEQIQQVRDDKIAKLNIVLAPLQEFRTLQLEKVEKEKQYKEASERVYLLNSKLRPNDLYGTIAGLFQKLSSKEKNYPKHEKITPQALQEFIAKRKEREANKIINAYTTEKARENVKYLKGTLEAAKTKFDNAAALEKQSQEMFDKTKASHAIALADFKEASDKGWYNPMKKMWVKVTQSSLKESEEALSSAEAVLKNTKKLLKQAKRAFEAHTEAASSK